MSKKQLNKTIQSILGSLALGFASTNAMALSAMPNLGSVATPSAALTATGFAPLRAWSDYGTNQNYGWTHTAKFYTFQVGSVSDISAGTRFDVNVRLQGTGASPLAFPGFSIWTSGATPTVQPYSSNEGYGHHWSQVRGPYDGGFAGNPCSIDCNMGSNGWMATWGNTAGGTNAPGNILTGHDGWVGYANAGYSFENGDYDLIPGLYAGSTNSANESKYWNSELEDYEPLTNVNSNSPWVNGGSASLAAGDAVLNLLGLKSGYYMIAVGGSCPDNNANGQGCAAGGTRGYQLTITSVPVPAAVWLFGSALVGLGVTGRRSKDRA